MTLIKFCKFHGFGNDYIVIESEQIPSQTDLAELAQTMCHRHTGVGSDGIAVLEKMGGNEADYFCEIVNPDGSIAGFSGNGTRCAAAYLYYKNIWTDERFRLMTKSGVKNFRLIETMAEGRYWFEAEIGRPKFASDQVPFKSDERLASVIDREIIVSDETFLISCVNVGNPVACTFVDNFDLDWLDIGRKLEVHDTFPERANIVFVKIIDRKNIELRIWERGAGETSSSGTCSSGAAILSAVTGKTGRKVSVHTKGGKTEVLWRDDDEILITGRADLAFCGEWPV